MLLRRGNGVPCPVTLGWLYIAVGCALRTISDANFLMRKPHPTILIPALRNLT